MKTEHDELRFRQIYVEITNVCNLSCRMCPKTKRPPRAVTPGEFRHILGEIYPFTRYIYPHVVGEPLCHPRLDELLGILDETGFITNITTNGTLIGEKGDILLRHPCVRQLNFSVHSSWENETFSEGYIETLLRFADSRKNALPRISFRVWTGRENANVSQILYHYGKTGEDFLSAPSRYATGGALKLWENTYLNSEDEFVWPIMGESENRDIFCWALRTHVGILSDGTVVPCCLDSDGNIPLGNIYSESFADIIESPRARAIYEGFSRRKAVEALCARCGYSKRSPAKI